jgi:hypothetical protein
MEPRKSNPGGTGDTGQLRSADPPELLEALALPPGPRAAAVEADTGVDPWEELEEAQAREEKALATIEQLRRRVAALESWLDAGAADRRIEHLQLQRLLLMKAAERDGRWWFVLSLPLALCVLYAMGVVILIWALLSGRL